MKKEIDNFIGKNHPYAKREIKCANCGKVIVVDGLKSRFCSRKCCNKYNLKHPDECTPRATRHILRELPNGDIESKRVTNEELEEYLNNGWELGRILK